MAKGTLTRIARIDHAIHLVRGIKVMLDSDLADLYGVSTRALIQAVTRNKERFPRDFMFRLTSREVEDLRSQSVISRSTHGGRRTLPYAFTEQGVAMLSGVLNSPRAIGANVEIMRAFVRSHGADRGPTPAMLVHKLAALERKYDDQFSVVFQAIRELMTPRHPSRKRIGFRA